MQVAESGGSARAPQRRGRRVRHEVRDSVAVATFSLGASIAVAVTIQLLVRMAG